MNRPEIEECPPATSMPRKSNQVDRGSSCGTARVAAHCTRNLLLAGAVLVGFGLAACGNSGVGSTGPAADVSEELSGGAGLFLAAGSSGPSLAAVDYVEQEFVAAGLATSYAAPDGLPTDGRFALQEAGSAEYRTRIVVRRPASPDRFNGTVVVEWLNVSGGVDAGPDYSFMAEEIVRSGFAWVGVSAQLIGVEGGPVVVTVPNASDLPGKGIKKIDPARYGTLHHPGDAYSYDMFTQVARALRVNSHGVLGRLRAERILGVGESQSAGTLTTYVDGIQPLSDAFDGFVIHSRGGGAAPIETTSGYFDVVAAIAGPPTIIRTDTEVPVLIVETESDVTSILGYYNARQEDSENIRLWEIAGTAHADAYLIGAAAAGIECGAPINDGPQRFIVRTALRAMDAWVRGDEAPPAAPRLVVDVGSGRPVIRRDADGNALGGIRTPQVDVPVAALGGEPGPAPSIICLLLGSTRPFSDERLRQLYPDAATYLDAYQRATDAAISAGFVVPEDRQAVLDDARPDVIPQ